MKQFSVSFLHSSRPAFPSRTLSSGAVWMCKCYLYIVCTLIFAKRSFCGVASLTWLPESITDKNTELFAFYVVSLKWSGVGLLGILRKYILMACQNFTEKAPISLWDYSTTKWSNEDPNQRLSTRALFSPQSGINRCPDETAMKEDQFLYYVFFRVDFPMICLHNWEDKIVDHKVKGGGGELFSRIHLPNSILSISHTTDKRRNVFSDRKKMKEVILFNVAPSTPLPKSHQRKPISCEVIEKRQLDSVW